MPGINYHKLVYSIGLSSIALRIVFKLTESVGLQVWPTFFTLDAQDTNTTCCVTIKAPSLNDIIVIIWDERWDGVACIPLSEVNGVTTDAKGNLVAKVYLSARTGEYLRLSGTGPIDIKLEDSPLYPGHHYGLRPSDNPPVGRRVPNPSKK